jgi:hypothetical protein
MKKLIILFLSLLVVLNCNKIGNSDNNKQLPKFEEVGKYKDQYIIRYSNVIQTIGGKPIKIPMYSGIYEDITYEDLEKQQTDKDIYLLGGIYIPAKDGEVKKTFYDILKFYKKSFFKDIDINKPSVIGNEGGEDLFIWYDFDYEGLPCSMMINVSYDPEATGKKIKKMYPSIKDGDKVKETIEMYEFKEDSKWIGIEINLGKYSKFKKQN